MPMLFTERTDEMLTLAEALAHHRDLLCADGAEVVALLQATGGFRFARLAEDGFAWPPPRPGALPNDMFLETVYSARLFRVTDGPELAELRWQHEAGGRGPAAFVHTGVACGNGHPIRCRLSASYLLWGAAIETATIETAAPDGWVCLTETRVGAHWIPFREPLAKGERLHLRSVELVGTEPRYGNSHVMDELLHGIATTPAERSANAQ